MDVLIAGAGIGGLVTALSLHDGGVDRVVLLEAAPELRPMGAGVNLLSNAVRELAALGLYRDVAALAVQTTEIRYHNQHGDLIMSEPRGRRGGYDWPQLSVRRGELQMVLARAVRERLGEHRLCTGTRVTGLAEETSVRVEVLRDGVPEVHTADLLVGADGINSTVRRLVAGAETEPVWNGMVVWRGMTWASPMCPANSMVVMGDGVRKIVVYAVTSPRADGQVLLNWAVSRRFEAADVDRSDWNRRVPAAKFAAGFAGWRVAGTVVTDLFEGADSCFEYPMLDRDPLPAWSRGSVTLLGDAAHAMQPMGSNATTQAVIDARALAFFLATETGVERAALAYEQHRRPMTTRVQLANRDMGPEAVINVVTARAPGGFTTVDEVLPVSVLHGIRDRYAALASFDRSSVNARSPYDIRRARLVGAKGDDAARRMSRSPARTRPQSSSGACTSIHSNHRSRRGSMTRTGRQYLESLRDGRQVWLDGELVKDVITHPAFRRTARSIADLYDLTHDLSLVDVLTVPDGDGGGRVHRAFRIPETYVDLVARRKAYKVWSEASFGYLGRSPDYMASGIAGFRAVPGVFATESFDGTPNLDAYYQRMAGGDLYQTFTITNPQIDRTKPASEQEEDDLFVRVVKELDGGVVVRGAKMIGTAAVFGDEIIVGTIEPLAPQDVDYAISFSIPIDTPGLKFISRASYEASARSVFDNPLSSRFDENDALLVCDDVFVPWERVLVYRDVKASLMQWWGTSAYANFVHQASTRFWTKLEFLSGLAILITKANNTYALQPVQNQLGKIMGWLNIAKSMVLAAEAAYEPVPGGQGVRINNEIASTHRAMAGEIYPMMIQEIKLLAGGGLIQLPASGFDLRHPELGALVSKYVRSPGHPAEQRMKLFKLAWDALGSEFASRHEQYERFYHGAPHVYFPMIVRDGRPDLLEQLVERCMQGYELADEPALPR